MAGQPLNLIGRVELTENRVFDAIYQIHPLSNYREIPVDEMTRRAFAFSEEMQRRRTERQFSSRQFPRQIIEQCVRAAATAPSGANLQPWHFVVVSNQVVKRQIRIAAEQEELEFYNRRAPKEWLDALEPLGTDQHKPFLELAPYLIAVFVERYGLLPDGQRVKHYYAMESVGIATGILTSTSRKLRIFCGPKASCIRSIPGKSITHERTNRCREDAPSG